MTINPANRITRSVVLNVFLFSLLCVAEPSAAQYQAAPITVTEPVAHQMLDSWLKTLARNDIPGLSAYYAEPAAVGAWQQRIEARRILQTELVGIHSITPAANKSWAGVPLSGEIRFTAQFWIDGYNQPITETRVWGVTNRNGYLQIATEAREAAPQINPQAERAASFPQFGSDQAPAAPNVVAAPPAPSPPSAPPTYSAPTYSAPPAQAPAVEPAQQTASAPAPTVTGSNKPGPIAKADLVKALWDTLLMRYKKSYEMRSETMYNRLFVRTPQASLTEFRDRMRAHSWLQIENLAIDEDSVRGDQLNANFRFRYSLWGPSLKRGEIIEVSASATKGGPGMSYGWRFTQLGDEVISAPPQRPGYYPTQGMLNAAVTPGSPGTRPGAMQQAQQPQRPGMFPGMGMGMGRQQQQGNRAPIWGFQQR